MTTNAVRAFDATLTIAGSTVCRHVGITVRETGEEIDITNACSDGDMEIDVGIQSWETDNIEVVYDTSSSVLQTLRGKYKNRVTVAVTILPYAGATSPAWSYSGNAKILEFQTSAPLRDVVRVTMRLKGTGALSGPTGS